MVFTTLCFVQLGNALSVRAVYHSLFVKGIFANKGMWGAIILTVILQLLIVYIPFLQPVFKTTTLNSNAIELISLVTLASLLCIELMKYLSNKIRNV